MSAPGITNLFQRRKCAVKKLHVVFTSFVAKESLWARKRPALTAAKAVLIIQTEHKISCFTEKPIGYARPKMDVPSLQMNFGSLSRQPAASVITHGFLEAACLHFLLTQLILFPSRVSEEVKD